MKSLKITLLLILSGLFLACNHTDRKIIKYVQSACPDDKDSCLIDLRQVLKIDYDRMYLFGEYTQDEIASIMGMPAYKSNKTIPDSEWRIILLKGNEIVYEDDFSIRFMRFSEITEKVDTIHKNTYYLLHYSPYYLIANMIANRRKDSGDIYYLLKEVSENAQYRRTGHDWQKGYIYEEVTK